MENDINKYIDYQSITDLVEYLNQIEDDKELIKLELQNLLIKTFYDLPDRTQIKKNELQKVFCEIIINENTSKEKTTSNKIPTLNSKTKLAFFEWLEDLKLEYKYEVNQTIEEHFDEEIKELRDKELFIDLAEYTNESKHLLIEEYKSAETYPVLNLYFKKFYTEDNQSEEWNKIHSKKASTFKYDRKRFVQYAEDFYYTTRLKVIKDDFEYKNFENRLSEDVYRPDLKSTNTYQICKKIEDELNSYYLAIKNNENFDTQSKATNIKYELNKIESIPLRISILKILCDTTNPTQQVKVKIAKDKMCKVDQLIIDKDQQRWDSEYSILRSSMVEEIERLESLPKEETTLRSFARHLIPLNEIKLKHLFSELVNNEFIDKQTNINHFYFVFGGIEVPPNTSDFKPIKWMKNKQLFRELIFGIKCEEFSHTGLFNETGVSKAEVARETHIFFQNKSNQKLHLASNRFISSIDSDKIKDILKGI